MKVKKQTV